MKKHDWIVVSGMCALLLATTLGLVLTRNFSSPMAQTRPRQVPLVDEQPVQTARSMIALASSQEEQRVAQQALRLADHAVDLAFADAIREATLRPVASTPATNELFARVSRAEAQVKSEQDMIDDLKKEPTQGRAGNRAMGQQLGLMQAQLELDKDELENAKSELLRSGADPLSRMRRQFTRYQAEQQEYDAARTQIAFPAPEPNSADNNLIAQFRVWRNQRAKAMQLRRARAETLQKHDQLQQEYDSPEQPAQTTGQLLQTSPSADRSQDQTVMASLRGHSERRKTLADLNKRIQDHQDLADVYENWIGLVQLRQQVVLHDILRSVLLILLIVLAVYLADRAIGILFAHLTPQHQGLRTLKLVVRIAFQAAGVLVMMFVLFGIPGQIPTILGLVGAGLTIALKDFILAFFGWFVLMGRNGIRVGDWVEIEGVGGEVVEVGLMRTVLLETGKWTDAGNPTGRKVAFMNSFAIEGHYFNLSTTGQWLWDELQVLVPATNDPYRIVDAIQKLVTDETKASTREAEQEWQHSTQSERTPSVSATPSISLRPTSSGVEVHVRYITRAHDRYETRRKLYQEIVALLRQSASEPATATRPVGAAT